jgi:hypothetical protein
MPLVYAAILADEEYNESARKCIWRQSKWANDTMEERIKRCISRRIWRRRESILLTLLFEIYWEEEHCMDEIKGI